MDIDVSRRPCPESVGWCQNQFWTWTSANVDVQILMVVVGENKDSAMKPQKIINKHTGRIINKHTGRGASALVQFVHGYKFFYACQHILFFQFLEILLSNNIANFDGLVLTKLIFQIVPGLVDQSRTIICQGSIFFGHIACDPVIIINENLFLPCQQQTNKVKIKKVLTKFVIRTSQSMFGRSGFDFFFQFSFCFTSRLILK